MAWKVYGAFNSCDPKIYGPLPCKRWVAVAGEKYKKSKRPAPPRACPDTKGIDERRAVEYARWLAARDGIELPEGSAGVKWDGITTREGKWSRRIISVSFHGNGKGQIIFLPNWDFDPAPPVESTVPAETAFADLLPRGLSILASACDGLESNEPVRELEAA